MPRNVPYRRNYSDVTNASQLFATNATIYILRQTGPFGFLLKEENDSKNYKVFLGDPHSCTCAAFRKEKDLCKHICWVLLKKFRLSQDDPLSWQLGLSDLELDEVMRGPEVARRQQQLREQRQQRQSRAARQVEEASGGRPLVAQRDIGDDDVCPICQDEFLNKKLPVTFCKFGCGNNVHIKCMKVWAEHQLKTSQDHVIKCPMCREDFGPITLLKQEMYNADTVGSGSGPGSSSSQQVASSQNQNRLDRHVGLGCSNCRMAPIEGKCYRCCVCADFYLCQACFNTPAHTHHLFQFRHKRNQRWRDAQRTLGAALPDAVLNDLMNRELSASDYDTLLQLDSGPQAGEVLSDLTEDVIHKLPMERVRERGPLLAPGAQCRVCLRGYTVGQFVRKLPCQHKFHKDCIDSWLLHSRPTCPIDSSPVFTARPPSNTISRPTAHNRGGSLSAVSHQGSGDSTAAGTGAFAQDEFRSLSVPELEVTSMRVGSGEGEGGRRGSLVRRQTRNLHIPHRPPAHMELTGMRVAANDDGSARQDRGRQSDMLVPGGRLIQEALQRRSHVNQQLTQLLMDHSSPVSGSPTEGMEEHGSLGDLTAGSGHGGRAGDHGQLLFDPQSAGPRSIAGDVLPRRQPLSSLRTKGTFRQRSGSHGQIPPAASNMQDLYLGNDPRVNPPPMGEVMAAQLSAASHTGLIFRPSAAFAHRGKPPRGGRGRGGSRGGGTHSSIALEGNNFTLRDLL